MKGVMGMGRWGGGTPESEQGGTEALFGYGDMVDQLCVVYPIVHLDEVQTNFQNRQEIKDAIVCDVVCLRWGQHPQVVAEEHRMIMVFAGRFIGLSKRNCGAGLPGSQIPPLLGTVTQDPKVGPSSRTWVPLHENQGAVMLADAWADGVGANFVPSSPQQVDQVRAQRQQQSQQTHNDQMGWPQDAQPRGQQAPQQGGWGQQQPQGGPPQGGWQSQPQQAAQPAQQQSWNQQPQQGAPAAQQGGWQQQAPAAQVPAWGTPQQSAPVPATSQGPTMPQATAQTTFDQIAAQAAPQGSPGPQQGSSGYAGSGQDDPWGSQGQGQQFPY